MLDLHETFQNFKIPIRAEGSLAPHTPHCPCPESVRSDFFHFFGPRWLQDAFKMPSRCNLFFILFLTSFFIDFYPNLAPTWPQLGPNLAPKSTPKPIQEPSWSEKVKKIRLKWGPNSSLSTNMSPKTPKVAPGCPHVRHFH